MNYGCLSSLFDIIEDSDSEEASLLKDGAAALPLPTSAAAALMMLAARDPMPKWTTEHLQRLINIGTNPLPESRLYLAAAIWLVARESANRYALCSLGERRTCTGTHEQIPSLITTRLWHGA